MVEVSKREKEAGIVPDPDIDTYMKGTILMLGSVDTSCEDDLIGRPTKRKGSIGRQPCHPKMPYHFMSIAAMASQILGLDICADTLVGDATRRGISSGEERRLTTGEMIVGPTKALFMDEITNGVDSSTAFQIVTCIQQLVHITDATALVSLLQPAPETFDLFDDLILMSEGKIMYHGPRDHVLEFFEDCGFRCPERKGVADFIQEVISRKDQAQYWCHMEVPYSYVSVDMFSRKELFRACASRELLLMKRNSFLYIFKATQMDIDVLHGSYYMGALFYALVNSTMTIERLEIFYKQKEFCFYPAWAYAIPSSVLKVPLSFVESLVWTSLTYYVIGYSPEIQSSMPVSLKWGFWVSPLTYGEIGLTLNEFLALRWQREFVNEVLETIELDGIKDALVGIPGVTGLSNEQRKRLTIAVELVANPSIIFMDEPTTGLDARAAAIVMRAVKNVVDTGRTILVLLKTGGQLIYSGPLGQHSSRVIEYFEGIPGVTKIRNNYNPATWMLEVTSTSAEAALGLDFAQKYRESALYE
uniref:ABC transporter domain-containing protein n=1 Tax=Fagus sylvatica TaxID=28930 RepID=A0A2N9IF51_FAGSY